MTAQFAYLPHDGDPYLLNSWLRGLPPGTHVQLLSNHPEARAILDAHDALESWVDLVEDGEMAQLAERLAREDRPTLAVPQALNRIPMRYRSGILVSEVAPHYPLLKQAWQWGFREVCFVTHGCEERVALPHILDTFHNRHQGQRCFVVGNGPSLGQLDMTRLKDEITLGSNRCFLGYETWGFPFTYWGVYDKFQIETYHGVYETGVPAETVKFFPLEYAPVLRVANGCPVNIQWPTLRDRCFSDSPQVVWVGFTVTYMLLQIAASMGCDPIILIGADHRYELTRRGYSRVFRRLRRQVTRRLRGGRIYDVALAAQRTWKKRAPNTGGPPALWSTADATSPTHFTADYTDGGKNQFLPPEPEEAERDFDEAHAWALCNGRKIFNATPGSALKSFPMVDFDDLF